MPARLSPRRRECTRLLHLLHGGCILVIHQHRNIETINPHCHPPKIRSDSEKTLTATLQKCITILNPPPLTATLQKCITILKPPLTATLQKCITILKKKTSLQPSLQPLPELHPGAGMSLNTLRLRDYIHIMHNACPTHRSGPAAPAPRFRRSCWLRCAGGAAGPG